MCVSTCTWKKHVSWDASPALLPPSCNMQLFQSFFYLVLFLQHQVWNPGLVRMSIVPYEHSFTEILLHPYVKILFIFKVEHIFFYPNRYILPKPCKCRYTLPCHLCWVHSAGALLSQTLQSRGICGTRALASRMHRHHLCTWNSEETVWIRLLLVRQLGGDGVERLVQGRKCLWSLSSRATFKDDWIQTGAKVSLYGQKSPHVQPW